MAYASVSQAWLFFRVGHGASGFILYCRAFSDSCNKDLESQVLILNDASPGGERKNENLNYWQVYKNIRSSLQRDENSSKIMNIQKVGL